MFSCYELKLWRTNADGYFYIAISDKLAKVIFLKFLWCFSRKVGKLTSYEITCSFVCYYRKRPSVINGNIRTFTRADMQRLKALPFDKDWCF